MVNGLAKLCILGAKKYSTIKEVYKEAVKARIIELVGEEKAVEILSK